jgi:hypothetical protein
MKFVILACAAEGEEFRLVGEPGNRASVTKEAERLRALAVRLAGSWADRFFVARLEEV